MLAHFILLSFYWISFYFTIFFLIHYFFVWICAITFCALFSNFGLLYMYCSRRRRWLTPHFFWHSVNKYLLPVQVWLLATAAARRLPSEYRCQFAFAICLVFAVRSRLRSNTPLHRRCAFVYCIRSFSIHTYICIYSLTRAHCCSF